MHEYAQQEQSKYQSMTDICALARSGGGAKYLDIPTARSFLKFVRKKNSAVTSAENFAFTPAGNEIIGKHDFFWTQTLPENHTWQSWYSFLNEKFAELLDTAKLDVNENYFHVWAGMKGDQSYD